MAGRHQAIVAAIFLLSGDAYAQGVDASGLDALTRTVERYITCRLNRDLDCMVELTDRGYFQDSGVLSYAIELEMARVLQEANPRLEYSTFEVAPPWEPFVSGKRVASVVPYYESYTDEPEGRRHERMGFLLASSYDDGESWRFVKIEGVNAALAKHIERQFPGIADRPLPPAIEQTISEPPLVQRRSVRTAGREFVMVGEGFVYALKWEIRAEVEGSLNVVIRYDNPADRSQPLIFQGSVEPGQQEVEWQSPVLTAFTPGELYDVVIEFSEPDSGDVRFELRQPLLFHPTREIWRAAMAQPPGEPAN